MTRISTALSTLISLLFTAGVFGGVVIAVSSTLA